MSNCTDLFKKHASELLMIAYFYLKDMDAAKDAVADCFEKLLKNDIVLDRNQEEVKAWLIVVVKNHVKDILKQKKNRLKLLSFINFDYLSENNWYKKAEKESLDRAMNHLTPKEAEVFKLHLDGYSNDEIREKLNVSYATVKNQLYDAKKKLRKIWEITGGLIVLWLLK
jgi:RNA polymerase sigma factor (sigma-70 family)